MSAEGAVYRPADAVADREQAAATASQRARALHHATFALALGRPQFSARTVATNPQLFVLLSTAATLLSLFLVWPQQSADAAVFWISLGFLFSLGLRLLLVLRGRVPNAVPPLLPDHELPLYTVLIPVYREAGMLPQLRRVLEGFDYPKDRLEAFLVMEEDDAETRTAATAIGLNSIVVPPGQPRTKPKACNFALHFTHGDYLVVYDAEDRPEPDQLRKAASAFRANPEISCFQARLVIDSGRSWLAAMFRLDYAVWFKLLLPGLARLDVPLPLGGTSNHFRKHALVQAGAWDPFNVTEDADLGLRLARLGHRVAMLDSATFEEAPERFTVWLKQRTRWIKGYMQTLLVHTRAPRSLFGAIGLKGWLIVQAFLGGTVWSALVSPLLWIAFLVSLVGGSPQHSWLETFAWISGLGLLTANIALASLPQVRSGKSVTAHLQVLTYPLFWLLISFCAYRALYQLLRDPFHWEKTPHGAAGQ